MGRHEIFTVLCTVAVLCGLFVQGYHDQTAYCAAFSPKTSKTNGWFTMQIDETAGMAYYNFNIDVANLGLSSLCKFPTASQSLKYHIHAFWANNTATSTFGSNCGSCGGHYDPNLACGPSSQYQKAPTAKVCSKIYRASSYGYKYSCNATTFGYQNPSGGYYDSCEIGDLSGKFGNVNVTNNVISKSYLADPLPPMVSDYMKASGATNYTMPFASVVFHCNDGSSPPTAVLCAKLFNSASSCSNQGPSPVVYGQAPPPPPPPPPPTPKTYSKQSFDGALAGTAIACLLVGAFTGVFWSRYHFKQTNTSPLSSSADKIPNPLQ